MFKHAASVSLSHGTITTSDHSIRIAYLNDDCWRQFSQALETNRFSGSACKHKYKMKSHYFVCIIAMAVVQFSNVAGHGYICDPPGRSSMWRKECGGFSTPTNVNDMGLNCGGLEVTHNGLPILP